MGGAKLFALAGAAALALAGCQKGGGANGALCTPFTPVASAAAPADASMNVDDCLHRWSYALAGNGNDHGRDDADMISDAAVAACASTLARWNQQTMTAPGAPGSNVEAPSLVTGQATNPITEHYSFARSRALFYVVQARAGHCAAPPLKNGAPEGLTR